MLPIEREMLIVSDQIGAIRDSSLWGADAGRRRAEHRFRRLGFSCSMISSSLFICKSCGKGFMVLRDWSVSGLLEGLHDRSQGERLRSYRNSVSHGTNTTSTTSLVRNSPPPPTELTTSKNGPPKRLPEHTTVKPYERRNGNACSVRA